jgi:hypothetical protein
MSEKRLLGKQMRAASSVSRKPDMKKQFPHVVRYVTNSDPDKKSVLSTGKPNTK